MYHLCSVIISTCMGNYLAAYMHVYLGACITFHIFSVYVCIIIGWGWKPSFLSDPQFNAFLCVRELRMPWWDCVFAQASLSCQCLQNRFICFIRLHLFFNSFSDFLPEVEDLNKL